MQCLLDVVHHIAETTDRAVKQSAQRDRSPIRHFPTVVEQKPLSRWSLRALCLLQLRGLLCRWSLSGLPNCNQLNCFGAYCLSMSEWRVLCGVPRWFACLSMPVVATMPATSNTASRVVDATPAARRKEQRVAPYDGDVTQSGNISRSIRPGRML